MNYRMFWSDVVPLAALLVFIKSLASTELVTQIQDRSTFEAIKSNPSGSVVFFGHGTKIQGREIALFKKTFRKAAEALKDFGVKFYVVECSKAEGIKDECSPSRDYVIAYRLGSQEEMELAILFDEDHVVGHVLMFLLTNEVTIAQDNYMWDQVMHENKGSKDVILAYVNGVGDREHRFFMEAAFVYGKEYRFVVTTENSMPGIQESGSLFYYRCKAARPKEDCQVKTRKKPPNSVLDVVRFIKLDGLSSVLKLEEFQSSILDKPDLAFPLYQVYLFSKNVDKIKTMAHKVANFSEESAFFILVDVNAHFDMLPEFGLSLGDDWDSGIVEIVLRPAHLVGSAEKYYEQWPLDLTVNVKNLVDLLKQYHFNPNDVYAKTVKMINIGYETIQKWEKPRQGIVVVGGCMQELSECTTFSIAFRRLARSIIFSQLEEVVDIIYIDFTDNSRDAQLNTIPGLILYNKGVEIKHEGAMDYESLLSFIWDNLSANVLRLPLSGSDHIPLPPSEYEGSDELGDEAEENFQEQLLNMEDDSMGKLAVDIVQKRKVPDEDVPTLTDQTFNLTRNSNELMVTLFYLPWCVKSIIVRGPFAQVVKRIKERKTDVSTAINTVNCFNWEDVCRKENVVAYPIVKVYRKGLAAMVYSDSLDVETMVASIERYRAPVLKELTDAKSIEAFMERKAPSPSPVSVIGLFDSKDARELDTFRNTAEKLFGRYTFAFASGNIAKESAKDFQFPMPSFVLVKRNDPVEHLTGSEDFNKINEFIEENSLSLYGELTAINFPKYKQYGKPFVIQFKDANQTDFDVVMKILAVQVNSVFVSWMDKSKKVTQDIMRAYTGNHVDPALVFVSHEQGKVNKYGGNLTGEDVLAWVNDCLQGKLLPTATLSDKEWKPLRKVIDYLDLVENAETKKRESGEAYTDEQIVSSEDMETAGGNGDASAGDDGDPDDGGQDDGGQDDGGQDDGGQDDGDQDGGDGTEEQPVEIDEPESTHDEL